MSAHVNTIKNLAIVQAVHRAQVLPVRNGKLSLHVEVHYQVPQPEPGASNWSDKPAGDPWGRMLLTVKSGDVAVDYFRAYERTPEVRPCDDSPPVWWA